MEESTTLPKIANGEQSFEALRLGHNEYVDKTALVYDLVHEDKYIFLSRPKRFGKSLLCDTLACYFSGRRELFEGLAIEKLETDWPQHAVIRFDLNGGTDVASLGLKIRDTIEPLETAYKIVPTAEDNYGSRFARLIRTAYAATKRGVVVIVDEYDYALQQTWGDEAAHDDCRRLMRQVFDILKSYSAQLRFVFITGIAHFSQVSLFSSLNNLTDVSFMPGYQALCGVTQQELEGRLRGHVQKLATLRKWSLDEALTALKEYYDGYHFCMDPEFEVLDIYNPYSLFRCLSGRVVKRYWTATNARELKNFVPDLPSALVRFEDVELSELTLESNDVGVDEPALYLYQVGLLTIKSFDEGYYTLRFANTEVREAVADSQLKAIWFPDPTDLKAMDLWRERQRRRRAFRDALCKRDLANAELLLRALLADFPYGNVERSDMKAEERCRDFTMTIAASVDIPYEREYHMESGVVDLVLWTPRYIYVCEFKTFTGGGAAAGCAQIVRNGYREPFRCLNREVVGLGIGTPDDGKGAIELREAIDEEKSE